METSAQYLGMHAIVIGSGIAGLLSARVLVEFFARVTVLERADIRDPLAPSRSVPQGHHAHFLLKRGEQIMETLFPGIVHDLVDLGAVPVRMGWDILVSGFLEQPRRDLDITCHCQTRGLLEYGLRRRLSEHPNIEMQWGQPVTALMADRDKHFVLGVKYRDKAGAERSLNADLVIEASGRAARSQRWLEELGFGSAPTLEIGMDLCYSSAIFQMTENPTRDWQGIVIGGRPPEDTRGALVLPIEGHRWIVTLGGRFGNYPPADYEGFLSFTKSLPSAAIFDAIKDARLAGEIHRYRFSASVWRRYDQMQAFPEGLIPIGDTFCSFNPLFGQGMTSAALQVESLQEMLTYRAGMRDPLAGLSKEFLRRAAEIAGIPWIQAAEIDFQYPQTRGERPPLDEDAVHYRKHLNALIWEDMEVQRQFNRVLHLMDHPKTLQEEPIYSKVRVHIQEYPDLVGVR
jgi:2-polyprenyl-6-methoxyphenol hydroxylase-like FAD-dependent oxidoreductase